MGDRLDAAVEAYLQAECQAINGDDSEYLRCGDRDREIVRAALLAALPVLLGPRVGWMWPQSGYIYSNVDVRLLDGADTSKARPVYAPSLGEGE